MRRYLSLALAAAFCLPVVAPERAAAALSLETLRSYVTRLGARIESTRGSLLVTSKAAGRGRVEIRLLNDNRKNRLGMYAYGFGNVANAGDRTELFGYLLRANSELGVGSFFGVKAAKRWQEAQDKCPRDRCAFTSSVTIRSMLPSVTSERGAKLASRLASISSWKLNGKK